MRIVFNKFFPFALVAGVFGLVYACALSFVYVEGDDATSVAYHALGRNAQLQPPYSSYHGMLDVFLGLLPSNEVLIRYTAITISALAAVSVVILTIKLIHGWLPHIGSAELALVAVVILLCSPEIFYLGMVYTPSLVAMSFVLSAHLLIRSTSRRFISSAGSARNVGPSFLLSALLFGIGVACRWDIGAYMLFVLVDVAVHALNGIELKRISKFILLWVGVALCASILSILASGYGVNEVLSTLNLARSELLSADSWFATLGAYQTLFTPAAILFFLLGILSLAYNRKRLALLVLIGTISVSPYLFSREPKMILPAFPAIWLAVAMGVDLVWSRNVRFKYWTAVTAGTTILLVIPWTIGLQIRSSETAWGPGFEVHPFGSDTFHARNTNLLKDTVDGRPVSASNMKLSLSGGFAIPTPEGPRPIGGHASVLFGGEWRELALKLDRERRSAIELAVTHELSIVQDTADSLLVTKLAEMGFSTKDSKRGHAGNGINERNFVDQQGRSVRLQVLQVRRSLFERAQIAELARLNPQQKIVLFTSYSSTFKKLNDTAPGSFQPLGPFSALVDLGQLHQSLSNE